MDLQYREFPCLAGSGELPHVATACARIKECSGRGYQVEVNYGPGEYEAHVLPTLAAAQAVAEQAVAEAKEEVERAAHDVRHRILTHPWWLALIGVEEVNKIVELTSIHPQGVVLIDPWGVCTWTPEGTGRTGQHLRIEIPPGDHCPACAAFALWRALESSVQRDSAFEAVVGAGTSLN